MSDKKPSPPSPAAPTGKRQRRYGPDPLRKRLLRWVVILVVIPYLTLALIVFFLQDRLLFYGDATRITDPLIAEAIARHGAEELRLTVEDGVELHGFFLPGEGAAPRRTLLYFGGNAETVGLKVGEYGAERRRGWNVVLVTYRGYGRSGGTPSARALLADALRLYDAMVARPDVDARRVVTWGRSLGTGVAAHLAANRAVAGVVLVSPYARLSEPAAHHYPWLPVKLLFLHEIDTLAIATTVNTPALFYHGTRDGVIPYGQSLKLQAAWQPTPQLITLERRGHNDVDSDPSYPDRGTEFLESVTGGTQGE